MIGKLFYSTSLLIWGAVQLPRMLKKAGNHKKWLFLQKIGFVSLPPLNSKKIWIHSVSLGETKAVEPLIQKIKEKYPSISIVCSHATIAGYQQSLKNPLVDASFILPIDFTFTMKRLVRKTNPTLFILVESDYWPSLLFELKKKKVPIAVVNGKISQRSFETYSKFSFLKNFTFELCDQILVQNDDYLEQFSKLGLKNPKMINCGNLKFDIKRRYLNTNELAIFAQKRAIPQNCPIITFGCTHAGEEELVLKTIESLSRTSNLYFIIAPRHLERVSEIQKKLPANTLVINEIGVLDAIYQLSTITVLGVSLIPGIGGHNLFEPLEAGTTLVYGPYVDAQKEMDDLIQKSNSAVKSDPENLSTIIQDLLISQEKRSLIKSAAASLLQVVKGSAEKTFQKVEKIIGD